MRPSQVMTCGKNTHGNMWCKPPVPQRCSACLPTIFGWIWLCHCHQKNNESLGTTKNHVFFYSKEFQVRFTCWVPTNGPRLATVVPGSIWMPALSAMQVDDNRTYIMCIYNIYNVQLYKYVCVYYVYVHIYIYYIAIYTVPIFFCVCTCSCI